MFRQKFTIFQKIVFYQFFSVFILLLTISFFAFHSVKNFYYEGIFNSLVKINRTLEKEIENYLSKKHSINKKKILEKRVFQDRLYQISKINNIRLTLIKKNGEVIFDSDKDFRVMENHANRSEVKQVLFEKKNIGKSIRYSDTVKKDMLYVASKIKSKKQIFILRSSQYLEQINQLFSKLLINIFVIIIIVFFGILIFSFLVVRSITKPFNQLIEFSQKIGKGDFKAKVEIQNKKSEVYKLASYLNEMSQKVSELFKKNSLQKNKLQTILNSLKEGLLVLSNKGIILEFNKSFQERFQKNNQNKIIGSHYQKMNCDALFLNYIDFFFENQKNKNNFKKIKKRFSFEGKTYSAQNISNDPKKIMIIFYDISEQKRLDKMKKDFVTNITHEIKTPLTSIKGYLELIDSKKVNEKKYLEIININTNRIVNLVNDLMELWTLENKSFKLDYSTFDIAEVIDNVLLIFDHKIKKSKVKIKHLKSKEKIFIDADLVRMEQVFINLIENSIKYSDENKKLEIVISYILKKNKVAISVKDNGIGIGKKYHNRIFERFFLIDKSRSKKIGTGIGLAIVKHIVKLHKGKIKLNSELGEGAEFIIELY